LPIANKSDQKLVYALRTAIYAGLQEGIIEGPSTIHRDTVTTYITKRDTVVDRDELWLRNTKSGSTQGAKLRFSSDADISDMWGGEVTKIKETKPEKKSVEKPKSRKISKYVTGVLAAAGVAAAVIGISFLPTPSDTSVNPKKNQEIVRKIDGSEQTIPPKRDPAEIGRQLDDLERSARGYRKSMDSDNASQAYRQWRSRSTYRPPAFSGEGREITEIVGEYNKSNITPRRSAPNLFQRQLLKIYDSFEETSHDIDKFAIIENPTERELDQIDLLRNSFYELTGYVTANDIFLYIGDGAKGVNIDRQGIGIHRSMLDVDFQEALDTYTHEIAHNEVGPHNESFARTLTALFGAAGTRRSDILLQQQSGEPLSTGSKYVVNAPIVWNRLREIAPILVN